MHRKKDNRGLTLVELMVSIAILAIVVLPLLTAFVVSLKTNAKAKDKLRAIEVAQNFMESMEAASVKDIMTQLTYIDTFKLLDKKEGVVVQQLLDQTDRFVKADSIQDLKVLHPGITPEAAEAQATTSMLRLDDGSYKFKGSSDGKYYYYVTNIPSQKDNKKRYAAMITIDADATKNPMSDVVRYNDMVITNIESANPSFDAMNLDIISNATLLSDINLSQGLSMTEDDLRFLTRTLTVEIKPQDGDKKKAKVTLYYSYDCKNYPEVNAEGDPVYDEETGEQNKISFHFPDEANKDRYTKVIFDNTSDTEGKTFLRDVYLFFEP